MGTRAQGDEPADTQEDAEVLTAELEEVFRGVAQLSFMRSLPLFPRHPRHVLEMMPSQAMVARLPLLAQRRAEHSSKKQHLLFGIPSRRCSFLKPLKVAFKA